MILLRMMEMSGDLMSDCGLERVGKENDERSG